MSRPTVSVTISYTREIDPEEMARRGRIGAHRLHATHDPRETTAAGRKAFLDRFSLEVDPDGALPEAERARRAEHAKKAYFAQLARRSAIARRKSAEAAEVRHAAA